MPVIARWSLSVLAAAALGSCSAERDSSQRVSDSAEVAVLPKPFQPFPSAEKVQLFIDMESYGSLEAALAAGPVDTLTAVERSEFESAFTLVAPDASMGDVACFIPHHFFRYLAADGSVLGDISVCFCCANSRISPEPQLPDGTLLYEDIGRVEALVSAMGHPVDIGCF